MSRTDSSRALVLTPWFPPAPGAKEGNFVLDQVRALAAEDVDVAVLVGLPWVPRPLASRVAAWKREIQVERYAEAGFALWVARYPSLPGHRLGSLAGPARLAALWPAIRRIARRRAVQVIHAHTEGMGYVGLRAGSRLGLPCVITLHGVNPLPRLTDTARKRRQLRATLEGAARVVLVGSPLREHFERFVVDVRNFAVVLNGFNVPTDLRPSERVPRAHRIRLVSVSNLHPNKGVDLTLRALALLEARGERDVELVVVGDGEERPRLARLAVELGVEGRVHFTGGLPHREALAEIAAGDVFCLPSWREACSIAHMEAMALGKVAIGASGCGPADYIVDGETGYLVEPRSADSLAAVLDTILSRWEEARPVGFRARDVAWSRLTWRHNARAIARIYRGVLADASREAIAQARPEAIPEAG